MAVEITSLTGLDPLEVQQTHEFLSQLMQEDNPSLDLKRGVLHDLVAYYSAIFGTKNQVEHDRLRRSFSLQAILDDPTLADDDLVTSLMSTFGIERLPGSNARGSVTIVVNAQTPLTITAGEIFEAQGKQFVTETEFSARLDESNLLSPTDRLLTAVGDGTFTFNIDVVAVEIGEASGLRKDTLIVPLSPPLSFVRAFTSEDFTGGLSQETNEQLAERLQEGIACKALSGRTHMRASLRAVEAFSRIIDDSIVGLGDAEMLRDQHTIFPGSLGGRTDWYVRTQEIPQLAGLTKTATLIEKTTDNRGIWQFAIGRDDAPGFYEVSRIIPAGSVDVLGTYTITEDIRSNDLTALDNDGFLPDIVDLAEGIYSRFQAAVIRFEDSDTPTADLIENESEQDYEITVRVMPLIAELQDYVSDRDVRNTAGDALVKAPMPCFLQVSFVIQLKAGQSQPDQDKIKEDLARLVNRYGFSGRLPASALTKVVQENLEEGSDLSAIDMFGRIRRPDGAYVYLRDTEVLTVPDQPEYMVTPNTVVFILDPTDIAISVTQL